jgi:hypothetical protein
LAVYTLSGTGIQALTSGTGALRVHISTLPDRAGNGQANPVNYYDIGLIRAGDGSAYWRAQPVDALDCWIGLPRGTTEIGYAFLNGAVVSVTEVAGTSPLVGPEGASGPAGPAGASGAAGPPSTVVLSTVLSANQTNVSMPAATWTDLPWSSVTIPVGSGYASLDIVTRGTLAFTSAFDRVFARAVIDAAADVPFTGAVNVCNGCTGQLPLDGHFVVASPSAGNHTFKLQAYGPSAQTILMRAAGVSEAFGIKAVERP